jgi:hypothetical protein
MIGTWDIMPTCNDRTPPLFRRAKGIPVLGVPRRTSLKGSPQMEPNVSITHRVIEMMEAHNRLNVYLNRRIVREDLMRSG